MKKFLILLLTLTLILGVFSSCGKKYVNPLDDETSSSPSEHTDSENITVDITESNETNQSENYNSEETSREDTEETTTNVENWIDNYNYTIEKIGDQYYIVFESYDLELEPDSHIVLVFDSVDQFLDALINNKLSNNDKAYIANSFERTANGIPIFNPYEFYIPSMPEPWTLSTTATSDVPFAMIRGHHVKFTADNEEASQQLVAEVLSKELFEERYNADKSLFTTIQNDQKTIKMRSWQLENDKYVITMYVTEGDLYYIYEIGFFDEMPSDEYLLSFGLKKYEG